MHFVVQCHDATGAVCRLWYANHSRPCRNEELRVLCILRCSAGPSLCLHCAAQSQLIMSRQPCPVGACPLVVNCAVNMLHTWPVVRHIAAAVLGSCCRLCCWCCQGVRCRLRQLAYGVQLCLQGRTAIRLPMLLWGRGQGCAAEAQQGHGDADCSQHRHWHWALTTFEAHHEGDQLRARI